MPTSGTCIRESSLIDIIVIPLLIYIYIDYYLRYGAPHIKIARTVNAGHMFEFCLVSLSSMSTRVVADLSPATVPCFDC